MVAQQPPNLLGVGSSPMGRVAVRMSSSTDMVVRLKGCRVGLLQYVNELPVDRLLTTHRKLRNEHGVMNRTCNWSIGLSVRTAACHAVRTSSTLVYSVINGRVAQLVRALVSYAGGWGFDSLPCYRSGECRLVAMAVDCKSTD